MELAQKPLLSTSLLIIRPTDWKIREDDVKYKGNCVKPSFITTFFLLRLALLSAYNLSLGWCQVHLFKEAIRPIINKLLLLAIQFILLLHNGLYLLFKQISYKRSFIGKNYFYLCIKSIKM